MMLFQPLTFGTDGHVQALSAGTIKTLVAGVAYDGRQPLVTTAGDAVTDVINGGFRVRQDGRVRITDATVALPATTYLNGGVRVTETGRLCVTLEDVGADVTILQGCACTNDGRVYMSLGAEPINSVLPVITGATAGSTSSVSNGTWSGSPTFGYRWFLDGVDIEGEISATIDTDEAWVGKTLSAVVWATNDGGSVSATAAGVVLVEGDSFVGPLDLVPSADWQFAYGVRALSAAMLGQNIFRLRRDSDDAELNFAADASTGEAPVSAIATWLSGADGFLVTLYDQSGNGRNVTNATAAEQLLWDSSLNAGKGGFVGDGGQLLAGASNSTFTNSISAFSVAKRIGGGTSNAIFGANSNSGENWIEFDVTHDHPRILLSGPAPTFAELSITATADQSVPLSSVFVLDGSLAAGAGSLTLNGVNLAATLVDNSPLSTITTPVNIMDDDSEITSAWSGDWFEGLACDGAMSGPNRALIRANEGTFYNVIVS